jgi:hypothetical protein
VKLWPLRFALRLEVMVDRPASPPDPPPVDEAQGAVVETSHHEGPPELGLTPPRGDAQC